MSEVKLKPNESLEAALRRLKKKLDRENTLRDYRSNQYYIKPSIIKREKKKKAKFTNWLNQQSELN